MYFHIILKTANSLTLDNYAWTYRLIIVITEKKDSNLEKNVKKFFEINACDIDVRNLKLLHFLTDELTLIQLPKKIQSQTGVWLIGYDGSIKGFSEDSHLLNDLFKIIDEMPMRKEEISVGQTCK